MEETLTKPSIFDGCPVTAVMSTRRGGVSAGGFGMNLSFRVGDREEDVHENRRRFFGMAGVGVSQIVVPSQVHGTCVRKVESPSNPGDCDGLITDRPAVYLCVTTADCVPILVFEPQRRVIGAFHAGWRGTADAIVSEGVRMMVSEFGADPGRMLAFIGPSAGACCYEVGPEVANKLSPMFVTRGDGRLIADLKRANADLLVKQGIPPQNIEIHPSCTIHESDRFHSHRRDGVRSGRMMAVIGITREL
jgi:YfiH family protein